MKSHLERLVRPIAFRFWVWRIIWRHVNGRWFVFRDAPDWVVFRFLTCEVAGLGEQANDEMMGRLRKLVRDLSNLQIVLSEQPSSNTP